MANNNGIITQPVVAKDISLVLGKGTLNIGTLIVTGDINKWARYKPVRYNTRSPLTIAQRSSVNYGLSVPTVPHYNDIPAAMTSDGENGWRYRKPRGTASLWSEPFRMRDFDGYNHNVLPPIHSFNATPKRATNQFSSSEISGSISAFIPQDENALPAGLNIKDFEEIKNCYFGIMAVNGSTVKRATASSKIIENGFLVELNCYRWDTGVWTIYPFLADNAFTQNQEDVQNTYYTIPTSVAQTIRIVSSYIEISFAPISINADNTIDVTITVTNNGYSSITLDSNVMQIRLSQNDFYDPMEPGEEYYPIDDFTVAANSSRTFTESHYVMSEIRENGGKVIVSLDSGNYMASSFILMVNPDEDGPVISPEF